MEKSGEVPKWENLSGDVLGIIFGKLKMMDVILGASRVCTSWFLASQNTTLWITVDLASHEKSFFYNPQVNPMEEHHLFRGPGMFYNAYVHRDLPQVKQGKKNLNLGNLLIEITKLSSATPKNLFFNFYTYIQDKELILAAERMPNVEKLVLPMWCTLNDSSFRFAFSQWKNLRTMVIVKNSSYTGSLELQVVGENCKNLTNLKFVGILDQHLADQIVLHLQVLKKLSLRCSYLCAEGLSLLIDGLQKLEILNLSHSTLIIALFPKLHFCKLSQADHAFLVPTQKLHRIIMCPDLPCCHICNDWFGNGRKIWPMSKYFDMFWQDDEIEEFKF